MLENNRNFKPILAYPNKTLSQLSFQTSRQLAVLEKIKVVLPENAGNHALHCLVSKKTLLVYTDSANLATQLRFHSEAMLDAANASATVKLSALKVKILPAYEQRKQKREPNLPSPLTVKLIAANSQAMQDPQLKAALLKLSSTLSRLQQENG